MAKQAGSGRSLPNKVDTRQLLAITIVLLSITGISVAAGLAIWLATSGERAETTRLVFSAVLPLFGTWVGTVLAFYFARENLQSATDNTLRLSGRLAPDAPVDQTMIPKSRIQSHTLSPGEDVNALRLKVLFDQMKAAQRQRIPIFNAAGAVSYVVHMSTLTAFADSVTKAPGSDAFTETMSDLLGNAQFKALVEAIGFVGPVAVIAEARAVMRSVPQCNDVFVTSNGGKDDPVLGWLTNTDLAGTA